MKKQFALTIVAGLAASGAAYAQGCPGDCDGNGEANINDFICFQVEWQNQTALGDCDGNGVYNINDFVCFQEVWQDFAQNGCPDGAVVDDDFESYDLGNLCGQGAWDAWFQNPDVCGEITDEQAFSGSQSLKLVGNSGPAGDDMVQIIEGVEGGQWTATAQTFMPEGAEGQMWFIMLNTYNHDNVGINWSLQVRFNADLDLVEADFDGQFAPLVYGEWVEFRAEIDLDADSVDYFYNGDQFVFGKSWIDGVSGGGEPRIQAIDLYAGEPGAQGLSCGYFDDVSLTEGIN